MFVVILIISIFLICFFVTQKDKKHLGEYKSHKVGDYWILFGNTPGIDRPPFLGRQTPTSTNSFNVAIDPPEKINLENSLYKKND